MSLSFVGDSSLSGDTLTATLNPNASTVAGDVMFAMIAGKATVTSVPSVTTSGADWDPVFPGRVVELQSGSVRWLYASVFMKIATSSDPATAYTWTFPADFTDTLCGYGITIATFRGITNPEIVSNLTAETQQYGGTTRSPAERPTLTRHGSSLSFAIGQSEPTLHTAYDFTLHTGGSLPGLAGISLASQDDGQSAGLWAINGIPEWNVPAGTGGVAMYFSMAIGTIPPTGLVRGLRIGAAGSGLILG